MPLTLSQTVGPTDEPLNLDEVKRHLRVTFADDDLVIFSMLQTARDHLERVTRRQFLTATWVYALDAFPTSDKAMIKLPRPPLQSVSSIAYQDSDNATQVLTLNTDYGVDILSEPGRIYLLPAKSWPSTYDVPNAVVITYIAGWDAPGKVPASLRGLLSLFVGHLYENREAVSAEKVLHEIPLGFQMLLASNKMVEVL